MKPTIDPRPISTPKVNGLTPEEEKRFLELVNDRIGTTHVDSHYAEFKRLKRKRWAKDVRNDNIVRNHALELFERLEAMVNAAWEITGEVMHAQKVQYQKLERARVKAGKLLAKITDQQLH